MSKSYVLFSLALGGLALVGCNKDEEKVNPITVPPATQSSTTAPSVPATMPDMPIPAIPTTGPTTAQVGAAIDDAKAAGSALKDKATDILGGIKAPTTIPSDATK